MTTIRDAFVATFGEDQAAALEAAAEEHKNGVHDDPGSDPFKWVALICIGYQCFEIDSYRAHHGITAPYEDVRAWLIKQGDLATHDGDFDYLAAAVGKYADYLPAEAVTA